MWVEVLKWSLNINIFGILQLIYVGIVKNNTERFCVDMYKSPFTMKSLNKAWSLSCIQTRTIIWLSSTCLQSVIWCQYYNWSENWDFFLKPQPWSIQTPWNTVKCKEYGTTTNLTGKECPPKFTDKARRTWIRDPERHQRFHWIGCRDSQWGWESIELIVHSLPNRMWQTPKTLEKRFSCHYAWSNPITQRTPFWQWSMVVVASYCGDAFHQHARMNATNYRAVLEENLFQPARDLRHWSGFKFKMSRN